jgi:hypothetical protein
MVRRSGFARESALILIRLSEEVVDNDAWLLTVPLARAIPCQKRNQETEKAINAVLQGFGDASKAQT